MIKEDNTQAIKKQLIEQIEKSMKGEQKTQLISQINKMSAKELEDFLKQNNLIRDNDKCIFCSIIDGDIPTYKLIENECAIATLEINPISKGHIIIIPKAHNKDIPKEANDLAAQISNHIKFLKPKSIEIIPGEMFGHAILNILPVYADENINSKRIKVDEAQLLALQATIRENVGKKESKPKTKEEKPKKKKIISDKNTWLPKRIP